MSAPRASSLPAASASAEPESAAAMASTNPPAITASAASAAPAGASPIAAPPFPLIQPAPQAEFPGALATRAEALPAGPSAAMTALAALPRVRGIVLRPSRAVNWARGVNQEAVLAQTRGAPPPTPCASCARGAGPFTTCVVVAERLGGSCANCHYGSEGTRCSLRAVKASTAFTAVNRPRRARNARK